ncbi:Uncharacterised protein [Shigella flexneri]|nr:Uncharacterised protein [Shigella flexneri]
MSMGSGRGQGSAQAWICLPNLLIKPIRPPLHHFSALIEILSMVVNSTNPVR